MKGKKKINHVRIEVTEKGTTVIIYTAKGEHVLKVDKGNGASFTTLDKSLYLTVCHLWF